MKRILTVLISALLLLFTLVALTLAQEGGYFVTGAVSAGGGHQRSSEDFVLQDTIGGTAVGEASSEDFSLESGDPEYDPSNNPPVADAGGPYLVAVGNTISLSATASSDPDGDSLTYYEWAQSPNLGTLAYAQGYAGPTYTAGTAGIATLTTTVSDGTLQDTATGIIVVYDPSAGFVTGGGWISSPAGAYAEDQTMSGKATFGFVSKYQAGAKIPTGKTQFQFKVANLDFKSDSYEWLVVSGARAQYKGSGTINGAGNNGFMLTAVDGQISGGGELDKFRLKIWDKATGNIIYDNQAGDGDDVALRTAIGGGSIVIHRR